MDEDEVPPPISGDSEPVASEFLPDAGADGSAALARYDPLTHYLAELRRFKPLSAEEERELAIRARDQADADAAYRLITSHLRLVVRMAMDFKRSWLNVLDLIQEGNVGLILAVKKFDPERGIRLSTYAAFWIRAYIIKFLLDNWGLVKIGTTNARRKLLFNLTQEKDRLERLGIEAGPKLLAERLDVKEQDVIDVQRGLGARDSSLDSPAGPNGERPLGESLASGEIAADVVVMQKEYRDLVKARLADYAAKLPVRERAILEDRLLAEEPATLRELGERFNLTREGVRQIEKRLLAELKDYLREGLRDYGEHVLDIGVDSGS